MNKTILFVDPVCPNPYNYSTLETGALGGTEASCLRVTNGLHKYGYNVWLAQRGRSDHETSNIHYIGLNTEIVGLNPSVVITLRDAGVYKTQIAKYPNAKHYLWMHDVVSGEYLQHMVYHLKDMTDVNMLAVSNWHRGQIHKALEPHLPLVPISINVVYGPLAEYCIKDATPYDPNKLIFFSSPHKGLLGTLEIFKKLRERDPEFKLYISNPGYFPSLEEVPENVIKLGTLTHRGVVEHVRTSLCLFYPNTVFEETFGLVMAEANAVGTPVLAHPIGAAPEVVSHPKEVMNCFEVDKVIERVISYKKGKRLIVKGRTQFTLNGVIKSWVKILEG